MTPDKSLTQKADKSLKKFDWSDPIGGLEEGAKHYLGELDPFDSTKKMAGKLPFWSTGARSFIRVGGKPAGICTDFRWQVAYTATPINTIDTPHAWDIDVGQAAINATLNQIFDPTGGPESYGLFHLMQSAVHQPLVEIQVLDALGTSLFFARGMFHQVNGNIARGQVSTLSAAFTGIAYQHYVTQQFQPYGKLAGKLQGAVGSLKNLTSTATGGLL